MQNHSSIEQAISEATGSRFILQQHQGVGGGSINAASRINGMHGDKPVSYFIKFNRASRLSMFEAEAEGLGEMAAADAICVPAVICTGTAGQQAFLVQEYLPFARGARGSAQQLGEQLAAMHRKTAAQFGWQRDNTIGSTPQHNQWTDSWIDFWRERRLAAQLAMAVDNGLGRSAVDRGERLCAEFSVLFDSYRPEASLLHGDLWSGNYAYLESGEPVIFDPAVYYGDREADLAMTELFGGFSTEFYRAYETSWPLDSGYAVRKTLYNLYHVLNHFNLFGGGYGMQAERMMSQLLAECG